MYLGIDCSTQSLKLLLVTAEHAVVADVSVHFDSELAHYATKGGVTRQTYGLPEEREVPGAIGPLVVTAPSALFIAALDRALLQLQALTHVDLSAVVAVSGSGQQHGSVWWRRGSQSRLATLDAREPLLPQLGSCFALPNAPIWMDSSTREDCAAMEAAVGGAENMAAITGSRAYERFTANQIRKVARLFPAVYADTERISLVSSMLACVLTGSYTPIDASDAAGMNLMDLRSRQWDGRLSACVDPSGQLPTKLGLVADSTAMVGTIAPYFVQRYGFSPQCTVVACTGDNPSTLAGLELRSPGDVGVSLGTSDTVFAVTANAHPSAAEGHVFVNPVDPRTQMIMAVFKNGSLTREAVRDDCAQGDWQQFNDSLRNTPAGCFGLMKFTFLESEITPTTHTTGTVRFDARDQEIAHFAEIAHVTDCAGGSIAMTSTLANAIECRALIESQCLSMQSHAQHLGLAQPQKLVASGGASVNAALLQVMADVFQAPVYVQRVNDGIVASSKPGLINTAALGAAYRAQQAAEAQSKPTTSAPDGGQQRATQTIELVIAAEPTPAHAAIYRTLSERFGRLEQRVVDKLAQ